MKTFSDLERLLASQPPRIGVLIGRVDVGKGREGLHLDQLGELLGSLANQTRVESIRASTAIEGYEVDAERADRLVHQPDSRVRNRNEREFAGYRDAIDELMRVEQPERLSIPFILHVHRRLYTHTGGGGGRFKLDENIIASRDESGRRVEIFAPPPPKDVEWMMVELADRYNGAWDEQLAHPLVLLGAFVLDLLAIHPVADGNGRLARLITTHELLRNGYGVRATSVSSSASIRPRTPTTRPCVTASAAGTRPSMTCGRGSSTSRACSLKPTTLSRRGSRPRAARKV